MDLGQPEHVFVNDLALGACRGTYQIVAPRVLKTVRGDDYLSLTLRDRSGEVPAKLWQCSPMLAQGLRDGMFAEVSGRVEMYRERTQFIIESLQLVDAGLVDLDLYRVTAAIQPQEVFSEVVALLESMEDPWLKTLARAYLADDEWRRRLCEWPAAQRMHHPYRHGLLEHVHSVMQLGAALAAHYPGVNRDLILMGLFLHDSGKLIELVGEPAPGYSVEGEMLGHITIGICELHVRAAAIEGFPPALLMQLKHIILSHHENPEYGSPKPPMFAEAQIVHTIEMLDAKMNAFVRESQLAAESSDASGALRYSKLLKRRIYTPPTEA